VGPGKKEGERKVLLEGWKRGRDGLDIPIRTAQGWEAGGIGLYWERYRRSPQKLEFGMGKKRGGGKVDGLSAEWVWKMARASAKGKPTWWLAKRRSVTVTENDGLNPIREAQDEGSRIGTKPSGVMTR
jgi:hypothetical protein